MEGAKPKRWREPKAKPGELKSQWGKLRYDTPDLCFAWGEGVGRHDGALLNDVFTSVRYQCSFFNDKPLPSFVDELTSRGYDITTLRFSIQKKREG